MKLRVQPWLTDSCVYFLNNLFKWYPTFIKNKVTVLEWGGGNSTLYFLGKGCKILTVEHNDEYINCIVSMARSIGYSISVESNLLASFEALNSFDLVILKSFSFEEIGEDILDYEWTFIVNDGVSRTELNESLIKNKSKSIVILDNVEYCANWGKLARCSAHPERVRSYRKIIRDHKWKHYLFEQPEGRLGHSAADSTGWEAPNRWISGVLWRENHILNELMVSNIGFPVVTADGVNDIDIITLSERCKYNWDEMKWIDDEYKDLFYLPRNFD